MDEKEKAQEKAIKFMIKEIEKDYVYWAHCREEIDTKLKELIARKIVLESAL